MANVKYWPLAKDWFNQGGNDDVEQPPINLSDKNAYVTDSQRWEFFKTSH